MNVIEFGNADIDDDDDDAPNLPCVEAQLMTLNEVFAHYAAGNPFKPGDIVTPREGYGNSLQGRPCVVLKIGPPSAPMTWPADPRETNSAFFGPRLDTRIATHNDEGEISAWWVESWNFQIWEDAP